MKRQKPFKYTVKSPLFLKKIKGIKKEQIIGVSIDVAKDFYRVLIFDFKGKIITKPFSIDVFKTGYAELLKLIDRAVKRRKAQKVFIAVEPVGSYGYQFGKLLKRDFDEVYYVNPYATSSNRNQKMLLGLKSDDIDCCSIGDLLTRGECYPYRQADDIYSDLNQDVYWREKKLKMVVTLKNQISRRLNKIFPGLDSEYNKNKPLYRTSFNCRLFWGVATMGLTPSRIQKISIDKLRALFSEAGLSIGEGTAERLREYFDKLIVVEDGSLKKDLELLSRDVRLFKTVSGELEDIEGEMIKLIQQTPARFISGQIPGVSDLLLASYIGIVGDISHYQDAGRIFSRAGLCPRVKQSGYYSGKGLGIKKAGNRLLRTILFKMATFVTWKEPYFHSYYKYLIETRKKPYKKAIIAVARKLNRVMFAIMKNQTSYNPPRSSAARDFGNINKPEELEDTLEVSPVLKEYDLKQKP